VTDINDNGVVLKLSTSNVGFLLTADISWQVEYELLRRRANLDSMVLKAGHHGSDTSTSQITITIVNRLDELARFKLYLAVLQYYGGASVKRYSDEE
jgi:competence protein ComEC